MAKTSMLMLAAIMVVGASQTGDSYIDAQRTWQVATGERDTKCPPSSCPWKKERTRMASGSATVVAHVSQYEHSHPLEEKMRRNQQKTDAGVRSG